MVNLVKNDKGVTIGFEFVAHTEKEKQVLAEIKSLMFWSYDEKTIEYDYSQTKTAKFIQRKYRERGNTLIRKPMVLKFKNHKEASEFFKKYPGYACVGVKNFREFVLDNEQDSKRFFENG